MTFVNAKDTPPPKNGDLLILVMKGNHEDEDFNPTEDGEIFTTIGFNAGDNDGEDFWHCAGWDWCGDQFTSTSGEILAWMEIPQRTSVI